MKFKCSDCQNSGNISTLTNLKDNTKFIVKQWYKDDNGLIHTLVICLECGAFHDCKMSFLKMFIGRLYKTQGVLKNQVIVDKINLATREDNSKTAHQHALSLMGIDKSTLKFLVDKKLYSEGLL